MYKQLIFSYVFLWCSCGLLTYLFDSKGLSYPWLWLGFPIAFTLLIGGAWIYDKLYPLEKEA